MRFVIFSDVDVDVEVDVFVYCIFVYCIFVFGILYFVFRILLILNMSHHMPSYLVYPYMLEVCMQLPFVKLMIARGET